MRGWALQVGVWMCMWAYRAAGQEPPTLQERLAHARVILSEVPLVDGHNDVPYQVRLGANNQLALFPFDQNLTTVEPWTHMHTDIPRLRDGQVGAQFWSAWIPCGSQYKNAATHVLEQVDVIHRLVMQYPDDLQLVTTSAGIQEAFVAGKIGSLIGLEGGHSIDSSLGVLRRLYNEGARYMTLTHNCNTPWADNAKAEGNMDGQTIEFDGLTAWGELVVKEMNRLGMMADLSHVAAQTMRDVLAVTAAPVIFSHSNARTICNVTRNVPDDVLASLSTNGGLVMVNFVPKYVTEDPAMATIPGVVEHINHIRNVAGIDHVGIGADYDGTAYLTPGLDDVSKYPYLLAELLLDPTWTDEDLRKLVGLNLIRVMQEVEQVRDSLVAEAPWDQPIPPEDVADYLDCANTWP